MKPQFLVAASSSGCGKTTFTMGLLRAWKRKGWKVQAYKCGPDYIDTQFHAIASGTPSINLDLWLSSEAHVQQLYATYSAQANACVVEGVMGLFDGYDRMQGSAAQISQCLDLPVILLVNAKSAAYSVAPLIYGFKHFNPSVRLVGVVFNQVASANHFSYLKDACQDAGVACLGYMSKCPDLVVPSRHLGLTLENQEVMEHWINQAADLVEAHVNLDLLAEVCQTEDKSQCLSSITKPSVDMQIAVARDEAFNFVYQANLNVLERMGTVHYFSPLHDKILPDSVGFVYLPGGYPELYVEQLSANQSMLQSIKDYAEKGGRLLAECGGMMYLSQQLFTAEDKSYPLVGVLPFSCTMKGARLHLGYRKMTYQGQEWLGHEFHYSDIMDASMLHSVTQQYAAKGNAVPTGLFRVKNVLAGYTHWYWGNKDLPLMIE